MPEVVATQLARGMRDVLPEEMARVRRIEAAFAETCREWGYGEIRTPIIEQLHLFTAAGTLSPQTLDRVYSFLDWDGWSGERVVLRPDSTIAAARLYSERLAGAAQGIQKLFYSQPVLRFTDDGSSREEWQCGVELVGEAGRAGDVELVALALEALDRMGVPDVTVRLSHAGLVRGVLAAAGLAPDEQSAAYDRLLDGDMAVVDEVEARLPQLSAPLRLLFEVEGDGSGYISNVRAALDNAIPALSAPLDELAFVVEALEALGLRPRIAAVLARRFEYYSGIVMNFECGGQRIGAGGRYDDLIGLVGGVPAPASGFALFAQPLATFMRGDEPVRSDTICVEPESNTPADVAAALAAAAQLRAAGVSVATVTRDARSARLTCRGAAGDFTLDRDGHGLVLHSMDDVVAELERTR